MNSAIVLFGLLTVITISCAYNKDRVNSPLTACSDPNSVWNACGTKCIDTCTGVIRPGFSCPVSCPAECVCQFGFKQRHSDGACVRCTHLVPLATENTPAITPASEEEEAKAIEAALAAEAPEELEE